MVWGSEWWPPKISMSLSPKTVNVTLYGKRDFADVIKDIEAGRLSWIIRMGPKCRHKCPYENKAVMI